MKTYTYKPEGYEGSVEITLPNYIERLEYAKESGIQLVQNDKGELKADPGKISLDIPIRMLKEAKKKVLSVSLKKGEKQYLSYEDLLDDPKCDKISAEIAKFATQGIDLGESQGQS